MFGLAKQALTAELLCTGNGNYERLQRRNEAILTAYTGTALEIFRAQPKPELAKNAKKCFFHCVRIKREKEAPC